MPALPATLVPLAFCDRPCDMPACRLYARAATRRRGTVPSCPSPAYSPLPTTPTCPLACHSLDAPLPCMLPGILFTLCLLYPKPTTTLPACHDCHYIYIQNWEALPLCACLPSCCCRPSSPPSAVPSYREAGVLPVFTTCSPYACHYYDCAQPPPSFPSAFACSPTTFEWEVVLPDSWWRIPIDPDGGGPHHLALPPPCRQWFFPVCGIPLPRRTCVWPWA